MAHPLKIIINNTNMRAAHRAATVTVTTAARAAARNVHQCSRFTFATTAAKSTEAKTTHSDSCITRQSSFGTFFGMPSAFVRNSQGFRNATKCFPPTTTTRAFFFQSQHQQQQLLQQQRRTYARIDRKYYSTTTTAAAIENVGNTTTSSGSPPSRQPKEDNNNNKQFIEHITTNFQFSTDDDGKPEPRIAISVIGVGGAGGNAINNMIKSGLKGVKFIACNTDAQSLSRSQADVRLQIGKNVTKGLGAGNHADIGKKAAEESIAEIEKVLENTHMVFITAGFGGGTGTGASPVIARVAKEKGILVVAVVTKPFSFEGKPRSKTAERGIEELSAYADTLLVVSNENLVSLSNETTSLINAFKQADEFLLGAIRSVTDLMVKPGLINLDFADIRSVMHNMGRAMMGSGEVEGPSSKARGTRAAELAISNKLLDADSSSLAGAKAIILNITGGPDMTLFEVDAAANRVRRELDDDANIIFGTSLDDAMTNKIRVSVMAMGIGQRRVV